ncbi:MAG: MBL fold metallo-hydrolase [candidate division Zixibacteria bacterium]
MARLEYGIRFGEHFAVDPTRKSDLAVVSHAHSDHLRAHKRIIATPATLELARFGYKKFEGEPLEYNKEIEIGPARLKLVPAGHMLGSAQVIIDWRDERIVYTGDFKLDENQTCEKAEIHRCDTLLIDTTYGKPQYRFPPASECKERLLEFVAKNLQANIIPVVLAYSFGKAQEAMKILSDEGIEIDAYKTAFEAAEVYGRHGISIENVNLLNEKPKRGRVIVMPPGGFRYINARGWGRFRTCFLSGWTLDRGNGSRGGNGFGIPFSDHASFDDIVRYVETAKPKKIYTLFGPPDIAEYLRRLGFKAESVGLNAGKTIGKSVGNMDLFN